MSEIVDPLTMWNKKVIFTRSCKMVVTISNLSKIFLHIMRTNFAIFHIFYDIEVCRERHVLLLIICFIGSEEEFEDTKGVISNRKATFLSTLS